MIGKLFSTGITLKYGYTGSNKHGWWASITINDMGHCEDGSVRGKLSTSYGHQDPAFSIDTIKADAERMGIEFLGVADEQPFLLYTDDANYPAPENTREVLEREANRIGWSFSFDGEYVPRRII